MIKSRRQARLTNKTRLAVHRGDLEGAEPVLLDEESGSGKSNLNSDGVEKGEDQGEHPSPIPSSATAVDGSDGEPGRLAYSCGGIREFLKAEEERSRLAGTPPLPSPSRRSTCVFRC